MRFSKICFYTIVAIYLLIFVGGVVRSSGAGMGCPDWPKCFGLWVPPTSIDELPANYQEVFGAKLKGEVLFNPIKTWIEYLNRLLGVIIGFFVLITLISSFWYKTTRLTKTLALLGFVLTLLQGWLGSKVVSSELSHSMINVHLFLALIILLVYIAIYRLQVDQGHIQYPIFLLLFAIALTVMQMFFGTEVRVAIDSLSKELAGSQRESWLDTIGMKFYIHRSFSLFVLFINLLLYRVAKSNDNGSNLSLYLLLILVAEIFTGVILYYAGFPAFAQPIHLLLATILLGLQFYMLFLNSLKSAQ
jgi:heme a synthase